MTVVLVLGSGLSYVDARMISVNSARSCLHTGRYTFDNDSKHPSCIDEHFNHMCAARQTLEGPIRRWALGNCLKSVVP